MPALSGIHSDKPRWVDRSLAGANLMPDDFCPDARARIEYPTKTGIPTVKSSYVCIGAVCGPFPPPKSSH